MAVSDGSRFGAGAPWRTAMSGGTPLVADVDGDGRADAVLANLDFFRGAEPDSGTCFEVGYAVALGKPVYGYIPEDGSFAQRIRQRYPQTIGADGRVDTHGWNFEEFGLPLNLMLAVPAPLIVGSVRDALARIAADNP